MANVIYDKARQKFLNGELSWLNDSFVVWLIDLDDYTPNTAIDEFLADIPAAARIAVSPALANKDATDGIADADNFAFAAVPEIQKADPDAEALVIVKDTGDPATSPLVTFKDAAGSSLPVRPNGGDIQVDWSEDPEKIFKL